jgi:DNA-binding response OmpR family regulator
VLSFGELEIDGRAREVRLSGSLVQLTRKEFDLLYLLASRGGATVDRREILSVVWHDDRAWLTRSRTVDTHVNSIRRKLDCNDIIRTQRGVGFRFDPEAAMNCVDDRVLTPA